MIITTGWGGILPRELHYRDNTMQNNEIDEVVEIDFRLERFDEATNPNELEGIELRHSRRLDVHRWSDHPEVKEFVNLIFYEEAAKFKGKIQHKHLKVVLLDL